MLKGIFAQHGGENSVLDTSYFISFYMATQMGPSAIIYRDLWIQSCVVLVDFLIRAVHRNEKPSQDRAKINIHARTGFGMHNASLRLIEKLGSYSLRIWNFFIPVLAPKFNFICVNHTRPKPECLI